MGELLLKKARKMGFIDTLAQQLGTQAVSGALGLGIGAINDQRQYNQQQKLQALSIKGSKELTDYQYMKQLQMWKDTNYSAQVEQMKLAGVNPALLYGMTGGGGTTTGSGGGSMGTAQAPVGGGEAIATMGMGLQLQMLKAQKDVLESQANLNNVEAKKKEGVDTKEAESRIQLNLEGVKTQKATQRLTNAQGALAEIQGKIEGGTIEEQIEHITALSSYAKGQVNILDTQVDIARATKEDNIKIIQQEAILQVLRKGLMQEQTNLTKAQTELTKHQWNLTEYQIRAIANQILINWDSLGDDKLNTLIKQQMTSHATEMPESVKAILGVVSQAVDGIMRKPGAGNRTPVGFK